jgi:hypothetical protein
VVGNGSTTTDDTAALNALLVRARNGADGKKGIYLPPGHTYLVSAPLNFQTGVSIIGGGWSQDSTFHTPALIKVAPGFVGTDVLKIDPGSGVVPELDGTAGTEPDLSWHWGKMEGFSIIGTGTSGPNAINPGWFGEASSIRNIQIYQVKDGIYLKGPQASATIDTVSVFKSRYGVNCDGIGSTVRLVGMSGDNNTSFLRVKGGVSTNVTLIGPKIENYDAGTGDPVFLIEDLTGGVVTVVGGWADTDGARDAVVRLIQPGGSTTRPKVLLLGFAANSLYYEPDQGRNPDLQPAGFDYEQSSGRFLQREHPVVRRLRRHRPRKPERGPWLARGQVGHVPNAERGLRRFNGYHRGAYRWGEGSWLRRVLRGAPTRHEPDQQHWFLWRYGGYQADGHRGERLCRGGHVTSRGTVHDGADHRFDHCRPGRIGEPDGRGDDCDGRLNRNPVQGDDRGGPHPGCADESDRLAAGDMAGHRVRCSPHPHAGLRLWRLCLRHHGH